MKWKEAKCINSCGRARSHSFSLRSNYTKNKKKQKFYSRVFKKGVGFKACSRLLVWAALGGLRFTCGIGGGDCISVPWLITKARGFLLALSGNTHSGAGQCHVMKIPKRPDGEARVWGMEAMWGTILEVDPPAPVAPSGEGAPADTLTATSVETLSHTPSHFQIPHPPTVRL